MRRFVLAWSAVLAACGSGTAATSTVDATGADVAADASEADAAADADAALPACEVSPTLASLTASYFGGSCTFAKCHAPPAPAAGLDLSANVAWSQLVNVPAHQPQAKAAGWVLVKPGDPDHSFLYKKVHGPADFGMLMPPGETEPMDPDCSIAKLRAWIQAGALP